MIHVIPEGSEVLIYAVFGGNPSNDKALMERLVCAYEEWYKAWKFGDDWQDPKNFEADCQALWAGNPTKANDFLLIREMAAKPVGFVWGDWIDSLKLPDGRAKPVEAITILQLMGPKDKFAAATHPDWNTTESFVPLLAALAGMREPSSPKAKEALSAFKSARSQPRFLFYHMASDRKIQRAVSRGERPSMAEISSEAAKLEMKLGRLFRAHALRSNLTMFTFLDERCGVWVPAYDLNEYPDGRDTYCLLQFCDLQGEFVVRNGTLSGSETYEIIDRFLLGYLGEMLEEEIDIGFASYQKIMQEDFGFLLEDPSLRIKIGSINGVPYNAALTDAAVD